MDQTWWLMHCAEHSSWQICQDGDAHQSPQLARSPHGTGSGMLTAVVICRSVRTRRFQTLSTQDLCQFLIVGVLSGLFWLQRAKNDTTAAASDTLGMHLTHSAYIGCHVLHC